LAYLLMRPGIGRIRKVFDYETAGGSPLLGVKGSVIITHGRARRRMVGFACAVAADTARTGVPQLIADWLREDATRIHSADADKQATAAGPAAAGEPDRVPVEPGGTAWRPASTSGRTPVRRE